MYGLNWDTEAISKKTRECPKLEKMEILHEIVIWTSITERWQFIYKRTGDIVWYSKNKRHSQLGDLIVSEYHTKSTTPTVFILFFAGGGRSCSDWWSQWWHHIARDVIDVGPKRGKCPDAVSVLLGDKFLNLCNHLDHVRSSGATNHDLKIIPGQVTMHVDFSVHWLTLLLEQIICKRTKKSALTWKRLCSILWKLEINQLQEASLLDFWQPVYSLQI